jgi:hypothetical protein
MPCRVHDAATITLAILRLVSYEGAKLYDPPSTSMVWLSRLRRRQVAGFGGQLVLVDDFS